MKVDIGGGFSVDKNLLDKYWKHISDRLEAKQYREVTEIQQLERERQELHNQLVKSGGFDPELRYQSKQEQLRTRYYDFSEALETFIANKLAQEEDGVQALNRRLLGN